MLNRPEAMNALSSRLMEEIEQASRDFLNDEETRVVVFRGSGKHFSAGADLKERRAVRNMVMQRRDFALGARMIRAITEIQQVTIAAIHGVALGGGACIPTACDFRIATEDAVCGYPEVNLGMNLMWQSLPLCVRLIGPARAKRMIMRQGKCRDAAGFGFPGPGGACDWTGSGCGPDGGSVCSPAAGGSADDQAEYQCGQRRDGPGDHAHGCRPEYADGVK
jgi:enoyl-CoA hydratase/carnithine racemase